MKARQRMTALGCAWEKVKRKREEKDTAEGPTLKLLKYLRMTCSNP